MSATTAADQRPVALVTGAAGGLGTVITSVLVRDGFRVAMVDVDAPRLARTVAALPPDEQPHALAVVADITDEAGVASSVATVESTWGAVDALVSNAGIEPVHQITGLDMQLWDATFAVNTRAPMLYVKHCAPSWVARSTGTVVFVGSRTWQSGSRNIAYAASKAALVGMARSVATDLGPSGVTANVVAPSFVRTPLHAQERVEEHARAFAAASPLRRLVEPVDVAHAVAFLVSARARNITGEVLHVAAGSQLAPALTAGRSPLSTEAS